MKTINLTRDLVTTVDDEDFESLSQFNWSAYPITGTGKNGKIYKYGFKAGRKIKGKRTWIHNVIMNPAEGQVVDHIDRNPLNNCRSNLRVCSKKENSLNRGKRSSNKTSKYLGVSKRSNDKKFNAAIKFEGKTIHLGYFDCEIEAAKAYNIKAKELFGEFAPLNIIET